MKTNGLNNGMEKEVYAKPAIEVEEMEVQWEYMGGGTQGSNTSANQKKVPAMCGGGSPEYEEDDY